MTAFCAHPGCIVALHALNLSGVCRVHMHSAACRCAWCRAPRKGARRKAVPRLRIKTREQLVSEGLLLPGLTYDPVLPRKEGLP